MTMKKISPSLYQKAVDWIADNDEDAEMDMTVISEQPTVLLVADLWSKEPMTVAKAVFNSRKLRGK